MPRAVRWKMKSLLLIVIICVYLLVSCLCSNEKKESTIFDLYEKVLVFPCPCKTPIDTINFSNAVCTDKELLNEDVFIKDIPTNLVMLQMAHALF